MVHALNCDSFVCPTLTLSQYMRHRRWTDLACLTETTERAGPKPTSVLRNGEDLPAMYVSERGQ